MGLAVVSLAPYAGRVQMMLGQRSLELNQMTLMKELATPYSGPSGEKAGEKASDSALVTVGGGGTGETGREIPTEQRNALLNHFGVCFVTEDCRGKTVRSLQGVMGMV